MHIHIEVWQAPKLTIAEKEQVRATIAAHGRGPLALRMAGIPTAAARRIPWSGKDFYDRWARSLIFALLLFLIGGGLQLAGLSEDTYGICYGIAIVCLIIDLYANLHDGLAYYSWLGRIQQQQLFDDRVYGELRGIRLYRFEPPGPEEAATQRGWLRQHGLITVLLYGLRISTRHTRALGLDPEQSRIAWRFLKLPLIIATLLPASFMLIHYAAPEGIGHSEGEAWTTLAIVILALIFMVAAGILLAYLIVVLNYLILTTIRLWKAPGG